MGIIHEPPKNHLATLLVDTLQRLRRAHDRVASLEDDVQAYRVLCQQSLRALHDVTVERDRLQEQHRRLVDEYRRLREYLLRVAA